MPARYVFQTSPVALVIQWITYRAQSKQGDPVISEVDMIAVADEVEIQRLPPWQGDWRADIGCGMAFNVNHPAVPSRLLKKIATGRAAHCLVQIDHQQRETKGTCSRCRVFFRAA